MASLKSVIVSLLIMCLALVVWVAINSMDDASYNDQGILSQIIKVPAEQNGYTLVAWLDDPEYQFFAKPCEEGELRAHVDGEKWNPEFVDRILRDNVRVLADIELAMQRPYFQFPEIESVDAILGYQNFLQVTRLLILRSKRFYQANDFAAAAADLKLALTLGERIKTEENSTLLSYMIGLAMQFWVLDAMKELAGVSTSPEQVAELQTIIQSLPAYQADGFGKVFYGEFKFAVLYGSEAKRSTLSKRLEDYRESVEMTAAMSGGDEGLFGMGKPGFWELMQVLIPDYYMHINEYLTEVAPFYIQMANQAPNYCNAVDLPKSDWQRSWSDVLLPNSATRAQSKTITGTFESYFTRHCLAHVYFDASKTVLAIKRFRLDHGELPESLQQLVPEYLSALPVDYFNGDTLKYSRDNAWLYSVGSNFTDQGGSVEGVYHGKCFGDQECYQNPTVLIVPKLLAQ